MKDAARSTVLELKARHAQAVQTAIEHWAASGAISDTQATLLADTIVARGFDWEAFAKHSMRLAVLFLAAAIFSIILEKRFLGIYKRIVKLPPWLRGAATAIIATGVHIFAYDRSQRVPRQTYANEALHGVGAIFFALTAYQLLEQLSRSLEDSYGRETTGRHACGSAEKGAHDGIDKDMKKRQRRARRRLERAMVQSVLLGLATVYGVVAVLSKSNFIWSCSMFVIGLFCWQKVFYESASSIHWHRVNQHAFTYTGLCLIVTAPQMRPYAITAPLWSTTRVWGLLYFLSSIWLVPLTNDSPRYKYRRLIWSFILLVAAGGSLLHGLRNDDSTTKGFGLTFLGINLVTTFYECCWGWSKPAFFTVLAVLFALSGRYVENVWNLRMEALG